MTALRFNSPPGWPTPPAGWSPPQGWAPHPAWPPAPHGWAFWVPEERRGRSHAARVALTIGAYVGLVAGFFVFMVIVGAAIAFADPTLIEDPARNSEFEAIASGAMLAPLAGMLALFAVLCPKVSYRRRDAFLVLVPFYGYFFVGMILWRITGLPNRAWAPRPDEFDHELLYTPGGAYAGR